MSDFKAALEWFEIEYWIEAEIIPEEANPVIKAHLESAKTALRIADRLQSGEVSEDAMNGFASASTGEVKAMAQQMIKEIDNE